MYRYLDSLLAKSKAKVKAEFNKLGSIGFDELNVVNTRKITKAMFDRLLALNESVYQKVANDAYSRAVKSAKSVGYSTDEEESPDEDWLFTVLMAYNLVTGYLYDRESDRKRLRLNEQILTAREYSDGNLLRNSARKTANLWWTQTAQYGVSIVDQATMKGFKDMGVKYVRWVSVKDDKTCSDCHDRNGEIYKLSEVPEKTHYQCRCYLEPVKEGER